jgi:hypothetical protein
MTLLSFLTLSALRFRLLRLILPLLAILLLAASSALTLTSCDSCTPPASSSLTVTLHPQETRMWCWAASCQMIMDFFGHDLNQCTQANNRFGRTDCCNSPVPAACVTGGWPEFEKYSFTFKTTSDAPLTWEQITQQIACQKKPFAFSWHWSGSGGHMMVVIGYSTVAGTNYVTVNDPWAPNVGDVSIKTYTAYVSGSGYTHWNDYYDVTYTGPGGQ